MNKDYAMRRTKTKANITGVSSSKGRVGLTGLEDASGLDIRPCGMFVQKRSSDHYNHHNSSHVPNIKVRVMKCDSSYHDDELTIGSQASFGNMKEIAAIRLEVDKLVKQVASMEMEIDRGKKVVERDILNLIEVLMMQLIKLDGIDAIGDLKLQRRMQVKRVQKYIETLDMLKIRISQHQQQMPENYHNQQRNTRSLLFSCGK